VVDLIGDLDAQLVRSFAASMERLSPTADERIVVRTRHVAQADAVGVRHLAIAVDAVRETGCEIAIVTENRRLRTLLRAAKIDPAIGYGADRPATIRHIMIVRNSDPNRDCA
jgi:anti-anti-sigma regulatory factor